MWPFNLMKEIKELKKKLQQMKSELLTELQMHKLTAEDRDKFLSDLIEAERKTDKAFQLLSEAYFEGFQHGRNNICKDAEYGWEHVSSVRKNTRESK